MFRIYNRERFCSVCRSTNMAQRYKCLKCNAYNLCVLCYADRLGASGHNRHHPMQLLLNRRQREIFIGGEPIPVMLANSFTCPVCGCDGLTRNDLIAHVSAQHNENNDLIFCPICVAVPNNDRVSRVWNISVHLSMCHVHLESICEEDQLQHDKFASLPNQLLKQHNGMIGGNDNAPAAFPILNIATMRPIALNMMNVSQLSVNTFVGRSTPAEGMALATERNRYLSLNIDGSNNDNDDDKPFHGFADALIDKENTDATQTAGRTYGIDGVIDTNAGNAEGNTAFGYLATAANNSNNCFGITQTQAIDHVANDVDDSDEIYPYRHNNNNSNESASFLLPRLLQQYPEVDGLSFTHGKDISLAHHKQKKAHIDTQLVTGSTEQ